MVSFDKVVKVKIKSSSQSPQKGDNNVDCGMFLIADVEKIFKDPKIQVVDGSLNVEHLYVCRATFKLLSQLNQQKAVPLHGINELLGMARRDDRLCGDSLEEFLTLLTDRMYKLNETIIEQLSVLLSLD